MRFVVRINPTKSAAGRLAAGTEVSFLPMEAVGEDGGVDLSRTTPLAEVSAGYTHFADGDVLIAKITPCFENGKATQVTGLVGGLGFGSTEFHVLRARAGLNGRFLLYLIRSAPFRDAGTASMYGAGGQKRVQSDFVADFVVPLPMKLEQAVIVAFLDRETAKIDALIAKQTEFLARLDEHRRALITEAVTSGLNPSVPMQYTGTRTFPAVPTHWVMRSLDTLIKPGSSITYGIVQAGPDVLGGIPYIRTSDMSGDRLPVTGYLRTSPEIARSYGRSRVKTGDLVIAIRATVGKTLEVPEWLDGANLTQGTAKIAPGKLTSSAYLMVVLNSTPAAQGFDYISKGATFKEITLEMLRKFRIPMPPLTEQRTILDHLDTNLRKLDATVQCSYSIITLLRERRAALITAAVTGQIDVTQPAHTEAAA